MTPAFARSSMSTSNSTTRDFHLRLTPSPEPPSNPSGVEKLTHYVTPPLSPILSRDSTGVTFAERDRFVMEDSGTRHLGQRSCPLPFGYDTYQSSTRYPQDTANQARSYLPMTASQVTSDGQRNYSYNYEQQPQYPSTPQIQDSSRQYDTGCPQINQRQIQRPAYSSGWIYNITVPAQPTQTPVGFESPQGYESRRSTTVIEPLPGNFGVPHQSYNASSDPSTAQLSTLTDYSTAQYPHQNQLSFQQITGVDSSTSSVQPRSASIYQPTTVEDYQLLLAMSNAAEDNCIVHPVVYEEDRNFQTFKTLLISIYRSIQEGNLSEAGQNLSTFTSEWFSDTLEEFGLTHDNKERYPERLQLWRDFNLCWLALLQKQKDLSSAKPSNDTTFLAPQIIMEIGLLKRLVDDIIRLCDRLDDIGLVDYELGVWEEEIVSVSIDCIQILEGEQPGSPSKKRSKMLSKSRRL